MKAVHWQVPFASLKGVQYRVDIYADGACASPVVLMGGATPFTTDEDNSDDYFAPVRSQTGNLTVIDEDGTLMEAIMPADNVDRPVRLMRINSNNTEDVMWQGFLSCEAYSQDYTARAQELTLNVNSVLEVMKSMEVSEETLSGYLVNNILPFGKVIELMEDMVEEIGHAITVYHAREIHTMLTGNGCGINPYLLTTEDDYMDDEGNTTTQVTSTFLYDILEKMCTTFGLCAMEDNGAIYIRMVGSNQSMYNATSKNINMSDMEWMGTGHTICTMSGARSISVVESVDNNNTLNTKLPECPKDDLYEKSYIIDPAGDNKLVIRAGFCKSDNKYGKLTFRRYGGTMSLTDASDVQYLPLAGYTMVNTNCWNNTSASGSASGTLLKRFDSAKGCDNYNYIAGALLCRYKTNYEEGLTDGLYMQHLLAGSFDIIDTIKQVAIDNGPAFSIKTKKRFFFADGTICISAGAKVVGVKAAKSGTKYNVTPFVEDAGAEDRERITTFYSVRVGNKYYQGGGTWGDTVAILRGHWYKGKLTDITTEDVEDTPDKFTIPVVGTLQGDFELMIWPWLVDKHMNDQEYDTARYEMVWVNREMYLDLIYSAIDIEYTESGNYEGRTEIRYKKVLSTHFADDKEIEVPIISYHNTAPASNYILNSSGRNASTVKMLEGTTNKDVIPEKYLLANMEYMYKNVLRKIDIEVARPSTPLPITIVHGYDGRNYKVIGHSMDWRTDTCKMTCLESKNRTAQS